MKKTIAAVSIASILAISTQSITNATERSYNWVPKVEKTCLAKNVYFEAKNQGKAGWLAVIFVTVN